MTFVSYAQNFEDVMLWRALKGIDKGFYVDVGAGDPIVDSVTQAFYERGWRGINIEPVQAFFEGLCAARPLDTNLPVAAADTESEITFYEIPKTGLSTIDNDVADRHRKAGWGVEERSVPAMALNQILEQHVTGPIHFLKIDVEGAEGAVLQGLNLKRWRPWILVIEATVPSSQELNYVAWEPRVVDAGYEMAYFDGLNRFYVASERPELSISLETPPNVFDDFFPYSDHGLSVRYTNMLVEVDQARSRLGEADRSFRRAQGELAVLREEAKSLRAELAESHSSRDAISEELKQALNDRERVLADLESQMTLGATLQERTAMLESEVEALTNRNRVLSYSLSAIETARNQLQSEFDAVWADRHTYWSALDEIYRSRGWQMLVHVRTLSEMLSSWKWRITRRPFALASLLIASIVSYFVRVLKQTGPGVRLLRRLKARFPRLAGRTLRWMSSSVARGAAKSGPHDNSMPDRMVLEYEDHYVNLLHRQLAKHQGDLGLGR